MCDQLFLDIVCVNFRHLNIVVACQYWLIKKQNKELVIGLFLNDERILHWL